jgi:hypothetical protein
MKVACQWFQRMVLAMGIVGLVGGAWGKDGKAVRIAGTEYLQDAAMVGPAPMLLPTPVPTPSPTPTPKKSVVAPRAEESAVPLRTRPSRDLVEVESRESWQSRTARESQTKAQWQPARGTLTVGQIIPVPESYSPAQVQAGRAGLTVIPATPTRFRGVETGVSFGPSGFSSVELDGFINYGSPIRTLVPMYGSDGRFLGYRQVIQSNPILQPVIRRTEFR